MWHVDDVVHGDQGSHVGGDGSVDGCGVAVILVRVERQSTVGWFEAEDGAEGRGQANAAAAVATKGDGEQAGGDGVGRARRTSAGVVGGVVRISWCSKGDVVASGVLVGACQYSYDHIGILWV